MLRDGQHQVAPTLVHITGAAYHTVREAQAELAPEGSSPVNLRIPNLTSPVTLVVFWWLGVRFVFGSIMSIAANVLSTWLPTRRQPAGWSPGLAPQIGTAA